ncbi:Uncharacterized protein FWK35_00008207 [Aphis craccivora]|uniref:Uncharacterized protein n=1 Tax=Aphis craccivora TaxID=307492 RepID=A0A6G0ZS57_APHCR|nr:Uncharacterized protein FWK35_00008207 [Aphis craccivora]
MRCERRFGDCVQRPSVSGFVSGRRRSVSCTFLLDVRVETAVVVGCVVDGALASVSIHQAVGALHVSVGVGILALALDVAGVSVVHAILEIVRRRGRRGGGVRLGR